MTYEYRSCMFLLLSAVAGFLSVAGAGITVKYVCRGDSVQAFQNIEFNCTANVHLVKHVDENAEIAVWSIQNCIRNESLHPEYQGKLIFDQNGTITIKNFDNSDQANYIVIVNYNSKMDTLPKIYEVQLSLMVAPTKACKPMIEQLGNSLIASLKAKDCGEPVAEPYWTDSDTHQPILKLTPGMEARTYNACIEGAAITCVKNLTSNDYCTTFTTEGSKSPPVSTETISANERIATSPPVSSETSGANEHIVVCIILIILFILAMLVLPVIFFLCRQRKINVNEKHWIMSTETPKLLEKDSDLENDREEAKIELQSCNDQDKFKELIKMCDVEMSFQQFESVFQVCSHVITCTVCSRSLKQFPLCKEVIEGKLSIYFD